MAAAFYPSFVDHLVFFVKDVSRSRRFYEVLLGTPAEHKMHRLFKSSHYIPPVPGAGITPREREQETLKWFDRYLGPVTARPSSAAAPE